MKTLGEFLVFISGLVFGTGSSILAKTLFEVKVDDKLFEKPLFQTFMMFVGMFLALPLYFLVKEKDSKGDTKEGNEGFQYEKLSKDVETNNKSKDSDNPFGNTRKTAKLILLLAIPSLFDLVATVLANKGLLSIDVSVYQLLKCTVIVFVAFVKRFILKTEYLNYMWFGIFLNTVAVCVVASTSFFPSNPGISDGQDSGSPETMDSFAIDSHRTSEKFIGVMFVVLSCLVQSVQYVFEEVIMSSNPSESGEPENENALDIENVHPLLVVGLEGFWGLLFNICFILPIAAYLPGDDCYITDTEGTQQCVYESTIDSFQMMAQSSSVFALTLGYVFVITGYNVFAVYVTYFLDSVWHAILDNFRPVSVWLTQLMLFQATKHRFGEQWTSSSYLQLAGLLLLLFGTAVYNGSYRLSCFVYEKLSKSSSYAMLERKNTTLLSQSPFITPRNFNHSSYNRALYEIASEVEDDED